MYCNSDIPRGACPGHREETLLGVWHELSVEILRRKLRQATTKDERNLADGCFSTA